MPNLLLSGSQVNHRESIGRSNFFSYIYGVQIERRTRKILFSNFNKRLRHVLWYSMPWMLDSVEISSGSISNNSDIQWHNSHMYLVFVNCECFRWTDLSSRGCQMKALQGSISVHQRRGWKLSWTLFFLELRIGDKMLLPSLFSNRPPLRKLL